MFNRFTGGRASRHSVSRLIAQGKTLRCRLRMESEKRDGSPLSQKNLEIFRAKYREPPSMERILRCIQMESLSLNRL